MSGTVLGSAKGARHGYSQTDSGNFQYLLGESVDNPGVSHGQFGIFLMASPAGGNYLIQNWVAIGTTAGSFQGNSGSGAGYYDTVRVIDARSFLSGQEVLYLGYTSAKYATFNYIYVKNLFGYNSTREGFQIKGANSAFFSNVTIVGAGQGKLASQDRNFQWDDSNGRLCYSIFYNGWGAAQIFSHGSRIDHNFISWQSETSILVGRTDGQGAFDYPSPRLNGDTLFIENNCIKKEGAIGSAAIEVQLRDAPVVVQNNVFDNFSTFWRDARGNAPTNTVILRGNHAGHCPTPSFGDNYNDAHDYSHQGLLAEGSYWYRRHYGNRTP
jgi:hypothetical protein